MVLGMVFEHEFAERAAVFHCGLGVFQGSLVENGFDNIGAHFGRMFAIGKIRFIRHDFVIWDEISAAWLRKGKQNFAVVQAFEHLIVASQRICCLQKLGHKWDII